MKSYFPTVPGSCHVAPSVKDNIYPYRLRYSNMGSPLPAVGGDTLLTASPPPRTRLVSYAAALLPPLAGTYACILRKQGRAGVPVPPATLTPSAEGAGGWLEDSDIVSAGQGGCAVIEICVSIFRIRYFERSAAALLPSDSSV